MNASAVADRLRAPERPPRSSRPERSPSTDRPRRARGRRSRLPHLRAGTAAPARRLAAAQLRRAVRAAWLPQRGVVSVVAANGTRLPWSGLPVIGYQRQRELTSARERRARPRAAPADPASLYDDDSAIDVSGSGAGATCWTWSSARATTRSPSRPERCAGRGRKAGAATSTTPRALPSAADIGVYSAKYQVPLSILQAVGDLSSDEFREALSRLQASEYLYETRLFPEIEFKFKHALIQDAAYQMLSRDRRKALHTAALSAGEQIYANRTTEKADWLAFHAFRAQVWDRAATHLQVAAAREIARAANRVAAQHLENALIAVDHLPVPERAPLAIDLRIGLRHALTPLGKVERTLQHLHKAEHLSTELNDKSRLGRIVSFIANCLLLQAQYSEALVTGARAVDIAKEIGDHRLQLTTQMYIARAKLCRGEFRTAISMYRGIIRELDALPLDEFLDLPVLPGVVARSNLAFSLAEGGAFVEAVAHSNEAARRADASAQPDSIMWANWGIGLVALLRGDPDKAVRVFERLLDMCRVHDLDAYTSRIMGALGCAKARIGHVNEGLALLREAVALDGSAEPQLTKSFTLAAMAEAIFLSGDLREALAIATQAVQRTRAHEERGTEAYACWLTGTIHNACSEGFEPAAEMFQAATAIATELRLQPLLAHCQLGLADLYERRGSSTEANSHREHGHLLLRELGMKPWFDLDGRLSSSF